jgi:hypothetical protein
MNDKQFRNYAIITGGVIAIVWLWKNYGKQIGQQLGVTNAPSLPMDNPQLATYAANPNAYNPRVLQVAPVQDTINIQNQGFGFLDNKYIPLFGFVGMAQGAFYQ